MIYYHYYHYYIKYIMTSTNANTNFILLDTSYFIFYRYYALIGWWKFAQPDIQIGNPIENEIFVEKFKKTFIDKLKEIPKRLKIKDYKLLHTNKTINYIQILDKHRHYKLTILQVQHLQHML